MSSRNGYLLRTYGITEAQYEAMEAAQDGRCFLCRKKARISRLAVDHDHTTKKVRALLCRRCNEGLGRFEWSDDVLGRLLVYVADIIDDRRFTAWKLSSYIAPKES
jgi:hypothetical protein